jgi:hypothetical protein
MGIMPLKRLTFNIRDDVWNPCLISCEYPVQKKSSFLLQCTKNQSSDHMVALMLCSEHPWYPFCIHFFFVEETLHNNLTNQQMINLWKFLMNLLKSEMLVCPDVLINCVFHVLRDKCPDHSSFVIIFSYLTHSLHLLNTMQ